MLQIHFVARNENCANTFTTLPRLTVNLADLNAFWRPPPRCFFSYLSIANSSLYPALVSSVFRPIGFAFIGKQFKINIIGDLNSWSPS